MKHLKLFEQFDAFDEDDWDEEDVNVEEEITRLEEELNYTNGFLKSVVAKLSDERFVNGAPATVVDKERQKQADAESRKTVIEEQLTELRKLG